MRKHRVYKYMKRGERLQCSKIKHKSQHVNKRDLWAIGAIGWPFEMPVVESSGLCAHNPPTFPDYQRTHD